VADSDVEATVNDEFAPSETDFAALGDAVNVTA
jgi:hypothetical protein